MESELINKLSDFGLAHLLDFTYKNMDIYNLDDIIDIDLNDEDYIEELNKLSDTDKNGLILFIKTIKTSNNVRNVSNYQSSQNTSTELTKEIGGNMRSCYLGILKFPTISITQRKDYFYNYFIKPHISNNEIIDKKTKINFQGKIYTFNQNTISIGRGCHEYPVDIVIPEREPIDLSVSRVNCLIFRVNTLEGIVYHLFDAWSLIETRVTKTNPFQICKTSKDEPNIISWNENENVYISCGDYYCNNKIQFISSKNENIDSNEQEHNCNEYKKAHCVICFEPANIRLGCGHAVYCSNECMDEHVAYQKQESETALCPYCKKDNVENKQSLCIEQYK
tara:strand:- start:46 stop:1053 length:1008 start_codon:yes stop_codon:yes gene_type:complete